MTPKAFDLAVIGAGPAGSEAAISASELGVETAVVDSYSYAGGQYFRTIPPAFQTAHTKRVADQGLALRRRLRHSAATVYLGTEVWGIFMNKQEGRWWVALDGPDTPCWLRAKSLILAGGAYDKPVAFPGWTLPGVITCGAALIFAKSYRIAPGRRALVTGSGPLVLSAAAHLSRLGIEIVAVCESSKLSPKSILSAPGLLGHPRVLQEAWDCFKSLTSRRIPYKMGWSILEAFGTDHVNQALIGRVDSDGFSIPGTEQRLNVDVIVCGYGLTPNTRLPRMVGCRMSHMTECGGWVPWRDRRLRTSLPNVYVVGDSAGIRGSENAILEGRLSGVVVAGSLGHLSERRVDHLSARITGKLKRTRRLAKTLYSLFPQRPGWASLAKTSTPLCRCEEASLGEIETAVAEGARSLDDVKMVTRAGMGSCQGRMCEGVVFSAVSRALGADGLPQGSIGHYSVRPPLRPLSLGALAKAGPDK